MNNVSFFIDAVSGENYAIIDRGNGEFTSMLKATYEATLAANSAPQG